MTDAANAGQGPLFTVINTFTLKQPQGAVGFEERFLSHVEWMKQQEGFRHHLAVRLTDSPDVYVNLGWWARGEDFQKVLASETFQAHAKEFHQVVGVEADPGITLVEVHGEPAEAGGPVAVLEFATAAQDPEKFEAAFRGYAAEPGNGFAFATLTRSVVRPGGYTVLTWWPSAEAYEAARVRPAYAEVRALAEVRTVTGQWLAGTKVAGGGGRA